MKADMPELRALTGARGLAAWMVVLFHIRTAAGTTFPDWLQAGLAKGYLAVDFFFMLSGFVLWLSYRDRLAAGGLKAAPHFLMRRVARIWPLHIVILAGAVLFALLLTLRGTPNAEQFPWGELPLHILLIQNWGFTHALSWNDPAWSISCEWAAYLAFPFLALAFDWRRIPPALLVALVIGIGAFLAAILAALGAQDLNHAIPQSGLIRALTEFTMGTMVCGLRQQWRTLPAVAILRRLAPLVMLSLVALPLLGELAAVPVAFAFLLLAIAFVADHRANPLAGGVAFYLGRISYSTYLVHYLLFMAFKLPLASATNISPALIALFLALTFVASVLLHHLVELPAQTWLNRRADRWKPARRSEVLPART